MVFILAAPHGSAGDAAEGAKGRSPWEWSDGERVAARTDDAAARARVRRAHAESGFRLRHKTGATIAVEPYDVLSGDREPHLFFESELFDRLLRTAYAEDERTRMAWRLTVEPARERLGLPADLWERLGKFSAAYFSDRRQEREIASSDRSESKREADVKVVISNLCRDRATALQEAKRQFGPDFTRFLYEGVAPGGGVTVLRKPDAASLEIDRGGCE